MQSIQAWSPSLRDVFEECPLRAKLRAIDRIPEPARPPLTAGQEYPNERGSRVHDCAELYVRGQGPMIREMRDFKTDFMALRGLYERGQVILEELWCFDTDWNEVPPVDGKHQWGKHWCRLKIDAFVRAHENLAIVIDYKTGKKWGNEVKHGDQVLDYAIATFEKIPAISHVIVELWYLDQNELTRQEISRGEAMHFKKRTNFRGTRVTTATTFKPDPSKHHCRFCPYKTGLIGKHGPEGTGHCQHNVRVEG